MKKFQDKAIKCALALCAATGMVACSSSDEAAEAPVNPTYDGVSVKTQFAINVAGANKNTTRMSAENTQNAGNYLEMTNVRLFTLAGVPGTGAGETTTLTSDIALADPTNVTTSRSSHIYSNVEIKEGTTDFLFYSTRAGLGTDMTSKFRTGAIKMFDNATSITDLVNITFAGEPILTGNPCAAPQEAFKKYLNDIVTALKAATNGTLVAVKDEFLKDFTDAHRAGSADAILRQVQDLYGKAGEVYSNTGSTDATKAEAKAIMDAIVEEVKQGETTLFAIKVTDGVLSYETANSQVAYYNFPIEQGLPDGTQILTYDGTNFSYKNTVAIDAGNDDIVDITKITYPLPIVYFDNTPARASDNEIANGMWPSTVGDWDAYAGGWSTANGWYDAVKATTRSIALQNNINYGVAGLKTTITCKTNTLEDNKKAYYPTEENQSISVVNPFEVTGILIGGQPSKVGWQMVKDDADVRDHVVYDKETNGAKAEYNAISAPIYTLVFDNYKNAVNQEDVKVVIELKNTNKEFYGQQGIIKEGQKFYLIGELKLDNASLTPEGAFKWPAYGTDGLNTSYEGRYPVKAGTAGTADGKRIFIQDYTTEANFTISSLKNAYVTIPDLRATLLQLGLSVDLQWQRGLKFDVEIE